MFGKSIFIPQKDKYRRKCRSEVYLYRASGHWANVSDLVAF